MSRASQVARSLVPTLLLLAFGSFAWAQSNLATIRGTVRDQSGAVVPGVEVVLNEVTTNIVVRSLISDDNGNYEIPDVKPGIYRLSAALTGFKTFVADRVEVEGNQLRRVDAVLTVGEVSQEVRVEAGATVITTDSAEIATRFKVDQQWHKAPISYGVLPNAFIATQAGVQSEHGAATLKVAGQDASQLANSMDGISMDGASNLLHNTDDFEEVNVLSSNNSAEYARAVNFTMTGKRGGNAFHGKIYYRHFNSALFARHYFQAKKPHDKQHLFGISASGPIFKNRTFYYVSWNENRRPSGAYARSTVPTLKMRAGDFSGQKTIVDPLTNKPFPGNIIPASRISPVSLKIQERFFPEPNLGGPDETLSNYGYMTPYSGSAHRLTFLNQRVDHQLTDNNAIFGRLITRDSPVVSPNGLPGLESTRSRRVYQVVVSDTHTFSPTLINTARFGWQGDTTVDGEEMRGLTPLRGGDVLDEIGLEGTNPNGLNGVGMPTFSITGMTTLTTDAQAYADNDDFSFADAVTWAKDRHVLKFGGEVKEILRYGEAISNNAYGSFAFNASMTKNGHAYADFLLGLPRTSTRLIPLTGRSRSAREVGVFVTDDFKIRPRVNLTLGLRWDYFGPATYDDGLMYNWDRTNGNIIVPAEALASVSPLFPVDRITIQTGEVVPNSKLTNFQPRVGIAWRPTDKWVVRGGYGSYTEQVGYFDRLLGGGPYEIQESFTNGITSLKPLFSFPDPFPAKAGNIPAQSAVGYPLDTDNGIIHSFNLSIERELMGMGIRTSYVGSRSLGQNYSWNINKPAPSSIPFTADRRPYPQFVNTTWRFSDGEATYDSFQVEVRRREGPVRYTAHYTFAGSMFNYSGVQDPTGPLEWSRDNFNSRHRAIFTAEFDLPFGRNRLLLSDANRFLEPIIGGWTLYTISYLQTGQYFTPTFSGSDPSNTNTMGGRPDRIADGNLARGERSIERWFDTSAFVEPPDGRYGNCGNNILIGPGLNSHNASLMKNFRIREGMTLTFGLVATNVFNHPHFNHPASNISVPGSVGRISAINWSLENAFARRVDGKLLLTW